MSDMTALVLVDLQTAAFGGFGIPPVDRPDLLLRNVRALLQAARASGLPVVHIQHCALPGEAFAEGAPGWPILALLAPEGSESVVRKRASNAFDGTDLHSKLQGIGARSLAVVGIQTEHCVAATCRGALRLGYTVYLAKDGHSTWPDGPRSAGEIMAAETSALENEGVTLRSTEDLVELVRSRPAPPRETDKGDAMNKEARATTGPALTAAQERLRDPCPGSRANPDYA